MAGSILCVVGAVGYASFCGLFDRLTDFQSVVLCGVQHIPALICLCRASGSSLAETEVLESDAEEGVEAKRPAASKKRAASVPKAPGQRSMAGKKSQVAGGGAAASGVAKKPRQNFVRIDKKVYAVPLHQT